MLSAVRAGIAIARVVFDGDVVLEANIRATQGSTVFQKNCERIHYISGNIMCCGAGSAADTEYSTQQISSQLVCIVLLFAGNRVCLLH